MLPRIVFRTSLDLNLRSVFFFIESDSFVFGNVRIILFQMIHLLSKELSPCL